MTPSMRRVMIIEQLRNTVLHKFRRVADTHRVRAYLMLHQFRTIKFVIDATIDRSRLWNLLGLNENKSKFIHATWCTLIDIDSFVYCLWPDLGIGNMGGCPGCTQENGIHKLIFYFKQIMIIFVVVNPDIAGELTTLSQSSQSVGKWGSFSPFLIPLCQGRFDLVA